MTTPNPTWYDILGVPRDASPEQVKAAWRTATDKFEPGSGSGQFRLFNEAADVLLDPVRRAEYDAGLAAEPVTVQEPPAPAAPGTDADTPGAPAIEPADGPDDPDAEPMTGRSWVLPVLAALTALALVAVVVAAGLLWNRSSDAGIDLVDGVTEGEIPARVAAGDSAQSAAARALVAVLSYDYRRMEADKERAQIGRAHV